MSAKLSLLAVALLQFADLPATDANVSVPHDSVLDTAMAAVQEASAIREEEASMETEEEPMQAWANEAVAPGRGFVFNPTAPTFSLAQQPDVPPPFATPSVSLDEFPEIASNKPSPAARVLSLKSRARADHKDAHVSRIASAPAVKKSTSSSSTGVKAQDMEGHVQDLILGMSGEKFIATPMGAHIKDVKNMLMTTLMPKVLEEHKNSQAQLNGLVAAVDRCDREKKVVLSAAIKRKRLYEARSPEHKICRGLEAVFSTERTSCFRTLRDKQSIKKEKCRQFATFANKLGNENANMQIMKKGGSESVESYITRITATVCGGRSVETVARKKGQAAHAPSMFVLYRQAKQKCVKAAAVVRTLAKHCRKREKKYRAKKQECDNVQVQMDSSACQRAVLVKDACESYSECYIDKLDAFRTAKKAVMEGEKDRKLEWRSLKRMLCLIDAFKDGRISNTEVDSCKKKVHDTNHLTINYAAEPKREKCIVPSLYPSTPQYKKKEMAPLPALAKGFVPNECAGVLEINTKPKKGSPKSCKCERVTLNGPFSPGPLVKCRNCWDVRRTEDKNSCPEGTKIFSPRSRIDWTTFLNSAGPLRHPNFVIDVTRPRNGCGGCTAHPMNSKIKKQRSWTTSDGSAWWLRSTRYNEPNGDYHANCYLDLWHTPKSPDAITFNDGKCNYHSKSYYCQSIRVSTKPPKGSPPSCKCEKVGLSGSYSPGALIRCSQCNRIRRSKDKNSCPPGTKLFSPQTRADWKTFLASAKPLRSPHWIIDVTRPSNGCGGCTRHSMNSKNPSQATWRTKDGSPWWLRSTKYNEPNGDYKANCYLDLWKTPANPETITFNDGRCSYHSNSYYCQSVNPTGKKKKQKCKTR